MCYCYLHIFPNQKIYVGTTQQERVERRWGSGGSGYKSQPLIWNAICKYGWENVRHKVIECETPEEMWEKEKELIKEYDTTNREHGYNLSIGGEKSAVGYKHTEEYKKKMREMNLGEKNHSYGKTLSDEQKNKLSRLLKGRKFTEEHRRKIGKSNKGRVISEETRQKISIANKGKVRTEEMKKKWSEQRKGKKMKPFTEEHRRHISESAKNRLKDKWLTPSGEIREMIVNMVSRWHPDWTRIHYLDEAVRMKSNILISRGVTRFQGIIDNIYYFSFDGLFTELRQSLTQQYPEYMFSIMKDGEEDFIQGILHTMTVNEIITELAKNKIVEEIISNISKGTFKDTEELAQDIYLDLLTKSPELIIGLYERNELKFFITRMVRNNLFSHNSPYFQKYQRWNERRSEITQDIKDNLENDRDQY